MTGATPMMDRGMIEYIVHQAIQNGGGGGGMMMGGGMGGAQNMQQGGGGGNDGMSWSQRRREAQAEQTPTRDRDLSEGGLASTKKTLFRFLFRLSAFRRSSWWKSS